MIGGTIFLDVDQDGIQDSNELGLPDIFVALWCAQNGQPATRVRDAQTDSIGRYAFHDLHPGSSCFVQVETQGYLYGPTVPGGNVLGPDGRSPVTQLMPGEVIDRFDGALYFAFEATCDKQCEEDIRECGWGVWNACTCQCDCAPGVCLTANQQCYDGCAAHSDPNPFGGCRPGKDCPWYPSKAGEAHCESSASFAGVYILHESAELCCRRHFGGSASCVADSVADVQAEEKAAQEKLARPRKYWPDMFQLKNCVFDSAYDQWMGSQAMSASYLFDDPQLCCSMWFPSRKDCPHAGSDTTPGQVDYKPDPNQQFYYPDLADKNCRRGRNYPMWMALSPRHYLYTTPELCCDQWYRGQSGCPAAEDDGVQDGFYWRVDTAFYPNFKGDNCATGNSWPEWMASPTERDTHLFATGKECCDHWFQETTMACQAGIVTVTDGRQVAGPIVTGTWYPVLAAKKCVDGTPPSWMTSSDGYRAAYVFDSHAECLKAHGWNS